MPSIAVPKILLLALLLSVISSAPLRAADDVQVYQFGEWTLIAPANVTPDTLQGDPQAIPVPADGIEFLAYWQDGSKRALALRFDGKDSAKDVAVMKSARTARRLKGCGLGSIARVKPLNETRPKDAATTVFPDGAAVLLAGSERGLRRVGELLVADMGPARVQLNEDSPIVRLGEWDSADFCRFELKVWVEGDEE